MNGQLVNTTTGELVTDVYHQMDRMDEQLILDEIKGAALDKLVFVSGNIKMLSLAGVREAVRRLNAGGQARIRVSDREPIVTETDDYVEVRVYAEDALNGGGSWGFKRQDKKTARGFALEMALSKAQRNALRSLIPEQWVVEMITAFLEQRNGVAQVPAPQRRQLQPERSEPTPIRQVVEDVLPGYSKEAAAKLLKTLRLSGERLKGVALDDPTRTITLARKFESVLSPKDREVAQEMTSTVLNGLFGVSTWGQLSAGQVDAVEKWVTHQSFAAQLPAVYDAIEDAKEAASAVAAAE